MVFLDVFDRDAGELGDLFGEGAKRAEFLVQPNVHGLPGHADFTRPRREAVARNLGEDFPHRVAELVHDGQELAFDLREVNGAGELVEVG